MKVNDSDPDGVVRGATGCHRSPAGLPQSSPASAVDCLLDAGDGRGWVSDLDDQAPEVLVFEFDDDGPGRVMLVRLAGELSASNAPLAASARKPAATMSQVLTGGGRKSDDGVLE